jgi:hypothetical protein
MFTSSQENVIGKRLQVTKVRQVATHQLYNTRYCNNMVLNKDFMRFLNNDNVQILLLEFDLNVRSI